MPPKQTMQTPKQTRSGSRTNVHVGAQTPSHTTGQTSAKILDTVTRTELSVSEIYNLILQLVERVKSLEQSNDDLRSKSKLEDKCKSTKSHISVFWQNNLTERKKAWYHYYQNHSKAQLYTRWIADTSNPNYIPLKFRPKQIHGEPPNATLNRINDARDSYRNNVALLKSYSESHQSKVSTIDENVTTHINQVTSIPEERQCLLSWWEADVLKCQEHSIQLWAKSESFLSRKRLENIESGDIELRKSPPPPTTTPTHNSNTDGNRDSRNKDSRNHNTRSQRNNSNRNYHNKSNNDQRNNNTQRDQRGFGNNNHSTPNYRHNNNRRTNHSTQHYNPNQDHSYTPPSYAAVASTPPPTHPYGSQTPHSSPYFHYPMAMWNQF